MTLRELVSRAARRAATAVGYEIPQRGVVSRREIARFLPSSPVVVEVGAHVGTDTVAMARAWPRAIIYALEPVPALYAQLLANTRSYPNVLAEEVALGATTGMQEMHISSGASDGSSSLLRPADHLVHHPDTVFSEALSVSAITLDEWAVRRGVAQVDFLWLDAQGAELAILRSGQEVLRTVQAVYTEVSLTETYVGVPLYSELKAWMAGQGFRPAIERLPWPDMGNVLFTRTSKSDDS